MAIHVLMFVFVFVHSCMLNEVWCPSNVCIRCNVIFPSATRSLNVASTSVPHFPIGAVLFDPCNARQENGENYTTRSFVIYTRGVTKWAGHVTRVEEMRIHEEI
jgi:hypothetical protein